jgi:hypothetical protein
MLYLSTCNDDCKPDVEGKLPRILLVLTSLSIVGHHDKRALGNLPMPPLQLQDVREQLLRHNFGLACIVDRDCYARQNAWWMVFGLDSVPSEVKS